MAMARREMRLGMALVLLMFLSGCIYSSTPEWGTGDGQIHVDIDGDIVLKFSQKWAARIRRHL